MRRSSTLLLALIVIMLTPAGALGATDVEVDDLLADGASYEGQVINVVGELVGDYGFRRNGFAWSQLNGDAYATAPLLEGGDRAGSNAGIGVRAPTDLIASLDPPGGYHQRGPIVRASGVWKHHDAERGGETYLDVTSFEVLEAGRPLQESADPAVVIAGMVLLVTTLGLAYRSRKQLGG
jgi:hypothetical protein